MEFGSYKNNLTSEKGMALSLVLVVIGTLIAFAGALLTYAINEKIIAGYQTKDIIKYYIAEAGIETAVTLLQEDFYYYEPITGSLNGGSFNIHFEDISGNKRKVISTGLVDDYFIVLTVIVEKDPELGISISEWIKP